MNAHSRWLAILAVAAAGCSSVETEHPVTGRPEALDKDLLEGAWIFEDENSQEDEILHLKFGGDNVGRLGSLEWKDGDFRVIRGEFVVAHAGEGRYASLRSEDDETGSWELLNYDFTSSGDLVVRSEPTEEFERTIAAGRLRGQVKKDGKDTSVRLASPSDTLLSFLSSASPGQLFGGEAIVLRKLTVTGGVE